jgi:hypothetical protein
MFRKFLSPNYPCENVNEAHQERVDPRAILKDRKTFHVLARFMPGYLVCTQMSDLMSLRVPTGEERQSRLLIIIMQQRRMFFQAVSQRHNSMPYSTAAYSEPRTTTSKLMTVGKLQIPKHGSLHSDTTGFIIFGCLVKKVINERRRSNNA